MLFDTVNVSELDYFGNTLQVKKSSDYINVSKRSNMNFSEKHLNYGFGLYL